jgi:hypothetical protein
MKKLLLNRFFSRLDMSNGVRTRHGASVDQAKEAREVHPGLQELSPDGQP